MSQENQGRCEFCSSKPCICDGDEGAQENASGKLVEAKKAVAALGLTLVHDVEYSEYIVKEKGSANDSDTSYHTSGDRPEDLEDAVASAKKMAEGLGLAAENPEEDPDAEEDEDPVGDEIFGSMARTIFVTAWADHEEEEGRRAAPPGEDVMDYAPEETPDAAYDVAEKILDEIEGVTKKEISELFEEACDDSDLDFDDLDTATEFGHYLAMMALGHGVSWEDDHKPLKFDVPSAEFAL